MQQAAGARDFPTASGTEGAPVFVCENERDCRSLKHLITLLDELQALGVAFVSLAEGIQRHRLAVYRCTSSVLSLSSRGRGSRNESKRAWRGPAGRGRPSADHGVDSRRRSWPGFRDCRCERRPESSVCLGRRCSARWPENPAESSPRACAFSSGIGPSGSAIWAARIHPFSGRGYGIGTRSFNSSNQLRTTLIWPRGVGPPSVRSAGKTMTNRSPSGIMS